METWNWEKPEDVVLALVTIYDKQTLDEKESEYTIHSNGVGFNAVDSSFLSSVAKQVLEKEFITESQLRIVQKLLPKYVKQLGAKSRSYNLSNVYIGNNTPKQKPAKNAGKLEIVGEDLVFTPYIYPTNIVKTFGFYWKKATKEYKAPISKTAIEGVLQSFPTTVVCSEVTDYLEDLSSSIELSEQTVKSDLFLHQKHGVEFMLRAKKALLAFEPGTGKTATAIFAANELPRNKYPRVLVVAPLTLVRNWRSEIRRWIDEEAIIWHGNINNWDNYDRWVITNYETVTRNISDIVAQNFEIVIIDETILIKNRKAQRSLAMKTLAKTSEYVWLLSGSPASKFYDDMWMQFHTLYPRRFSSYWRFAETYCVLEETQWGTSIVDNQQDSSDRIKSDFSDIYLSLSQKEVLDVPDWIFEDHEVEMSSYQAKVYQEMEEDFLAELDEDTVLFAPIVLTQMLRLMQLASNPLLVDGKDDSNKWKAVIDLLEYIDHPVILWTQFISTATFLKEKLSSRYRVGILTGETSAEDRQKTVEGFQSGDIDIIIAHPKVGKFGLTLTRARTAIYVERSFDGDDYYQSLYRIKRIGTKYAPRVIHLMSAKPGTGNTRTIDHVVGSVLEFRKDSSLRLTCGMIRNLFEKGG